MQLPDGRVFLAFRLNGGTPLWSAFSHDTAKTWTEPVPLKGSPGTPYAVWPQLKLLSNGVLVLASGRPGIGFWLCPTANPANATWIGYDVQEQHTKHVPSDPWTKADGTTSYTGIAEVEPGVVLLAYDKIGARPLLRSLRAQAWFRHELLCAQAPRAPGLLAWWCSKLSDSWAAAALRRGEPDRGYPEGLQRAHHRHALI